MTTPALHENLETTNNFEQNVDLFINKKNYDNLRWFDPLAEITHSNVSNLKKIVPEGEEGKLAFILRYLIYKVDHQTDDKDIPTGFDFQSIQKYLGENKKDKREIRKLQYGFYYEGVQLGVGSSRTVNTDEALAKIKDYFTSSWPIPDFQKPNDIYDPLSGGGIFTFNKEYQTQLNNWFDEAIAYYDFLTKNLKNKPTEFLKVRDSAIKEQAKFAQMERAYLFSKGNLDVLKSEVLANLKKELATDLLLPEKYETFLKMNPNSDYAPLYWLAVNMEKDFPPKKYQDELHDMPIQEVLNFFSKNNAEKYGFYCEGNMWYVRGAENDGDKESKYKDFYIGANPPDFKKIIEIINQAVFTPPTISFSHLTSPSINKKNHFLKDDNKEKISQLLQIGGILSKNIETAYSESEKLKYGDPLYFNAVQAPSLEFQKYFYEQNREKIQWVAFPNNIKISSFSFNGFDLSTIDHSKLFGMRNKEGDYFIKYDSNPPLYFQFKNRSFQLINPIMPDVQVQSSGNPTQFENVYEEIKDPATVEARYDRDAIINKLTTKGFRVLNFEKNEENKGYEGITVGLQLNNENYLLIYNFQGTESLLQQTPTPKYIYEGKEIKKKEHIGSAVSLTLNDETEIKETKEKDPEIREMLTKQLEEKGYTVTKGNFIEGAKDEISFYHFELEANGKKFNFRYTGTKEILEDYSLDNKIKSWTYYLTNPLDIFNLSSLITGKMNLQIHIPTAENFDKEFPEGQDIVEINKEQYDTSVQDSAPTSEHQQQLNETQESAEILIDQAIAVFKEKTTDEIMQMDETMLLQTVAKITDTLNNPFVQDGAFARIPSMQDKTKNHLENTGLENDKITAIGDRLKNIFETELHIQFPQINDLDVFSFSITENGIVEILKQQIDVAKDPLMGGNRVAGAQVQRKIDILAKKIEKGEPVDRAMYMKEVFEIAKDHMLIAGQDDLKLPSFYGIEGTVIVKVVQFLRKLLSQFSDINNPKSLAYKLLSKSSKDVSELLNIHGKIEKVRITENGGHLKYRVTQDEYFAKGTIILPPDPKDNSKPKNPVQIFIDGTPMETIIKEENKPFESIANTLKGQLQVDMPIPPQEFWTLAKENQINEERIQVLIPGGAVMENIKLGKVEDLEKENIKEENFEEDTEQ